MYCSDINDVSKMTDTSRIYIYTDSQLLKVDAIFEKPIFLEILPVNIYHFKDFIYIY